MSELKYKVGDKVRIKNIDWYNENKNSDDNYSVVFADGWHFTESMSKFCGKELIIESISHAVNPPHYMMRDNIFAWTDEMIEGFVEDDVIDIDDFQDDDEIIDIIDEYVHRLKDNECQIYLPEGYQFIDENGNVINATKIVLEKKQKEYPKTYEECYGIMGVKLSDCYIQGYKSPLLEDLQQLLICRDAYWKIAGEEMGLRKPWENSKYEVVYGICRDEGIIVKQDNYWGDTHVFEFPIREMRDAFYEAFKKEIESCKELL